ncbi:hypothetical protein C8R46DRAFT_1079568 [Mycena filopes]|nr:hypothetical protein C8R46DRAFT_1079568 [Mycena filopes]
MNRWRYFSMSGKREESVDLSGLQPNCVDPLVIAIQDPDQLETDEEGLARPTFTSAMPAWLTMNIWVSELPKAPALAPLRFTSIVMTEYSLSILTQPRSIIEFLCACPQLEAFFFTGWQHDDEVPTSPLPIARLPNLRTLHLRSTCGTRSLLSYIDAPRLTELHLAQLNVEFTLEAPVPLLDGDSDDEARDFSRSASSDRATGMGFRALLLRSNPPLRVLDMDWSDMRTKDFKFVFGRLGSLEHFFIEASDMSDKVIELLRPYVPPRGGERLRVRLPRLKSLELSNCNELSGEALLGVLSERVRVTDRLPTWEGNTLDEVIISECAGFKRQHGELLRQELGSRLRLRD